MGFPFLRPLARFLAALSIAFGLWAGSGLAATPAGPTAAVRVGLTPVFLDDQMAFLISWRDYLQARLKRPVIFTQRQSYREIVDLLREGQLDFAWICGFPYVRHMSQMRLLAVPVYQGEPLYRSYLIVPASDTATRSLDDLRDKVFAFSDPDSNSGHLFTLYELHRRQESPASFFSRVFFTWAHRNVVQAVAAGLAQGGAVDGYVWETLRIYHPDLTGRTRVVAKSPQFGHPPFAARSSISSQEFAQMQAVLVGMTGDAEGRRLLRQLNLDGFVPGDPQLFDSVARMMRAVSGG